MNIEKEKYPVVRDLDSIFYKADRNGKEVELCFTDLTEIEQESILSNASNDELINLCKNLAANFRNIADIEDLFNHPEMAEGMKRFGFILKIPYKRKTDK